MYNNVIPFSLRSIYNLEEVKETLSKENIKYSFVYCGSVGKNNILNLFFKEPQNSGFQTRKRKVTLSKKDDMIIVEDNVVEDWETYKLSNSRRKSPNQARIDMGDFYN